MGSLHGPDCSGEHVAGTLTQFELSRLRVSAQPSRIHRYKRANRSCLDIHPIPREAMFPPAYQLPADSFRLELPYQNASWIHGVCKMSSPKPTRDITYPLVNVYIINYGESPFLMGESTNSMAMFKFANCKRLPEGKV